MRLALRNDEAVAGPRLDVAAAERKARFAFEQGENLVLIVVDMKRRRVALGRAVLQHA